MACMTIVITQSSLSRIAATTCNLGLAQLLIRLKLVVCFLIQHRLHSTLDSLLQQLATLSNQVAAIDKQVFHGEATKSSPTRQEPPPEEKTTDHIQLEVPPPMSDDGNLAVARCFPQLTHRDTPKTYAHNVSPFLDMFSTPIVNDQDSE